MCTYFRFLCSTAAANSPLISSAVTVPSAAVHLCASVFVCACIYKNIVWCRRYRCLCFALHCRRRSRCRRRLCLLRLHFAAFFTFVQYIQCFTVFDTHAYIKLIAVHIHTYTYPYVSPALRANCSCSVCHPLGAPYAGQIGICHVSMFRSVVVICCAAVC